MNKIYLDYAATTPTDPRVIDAMTPYFFEHFGNASSPHAFGQETRKAIEDARATIADAIGADPSEIVLTGSATEANNQAVFGMAASMQERGGHIIASPLEHHAVLEPLEQLIKQGFQVTYLDVAPDTGLIDPETVRMALRSDTVLIAVMHASNEIGTIQPIEAIGAIAREVGVPFLVDAVQTTGHLPVNVRRIQCDLLSLSAHKFYGPKGIGALYIRQGLKPRKLIWGGDQERERRASTQNIAGAVGMAKALSLCLTQMDDEALQQTQWRDQIIDYILGKIDGVVLNGDRDIRLPNNANLSFDGIKGEDLITALDMDGIAVSMGSACTSGALEPSHVLTSIGRNKEQAFGSLRVTLGRWTNQNHVDRFLEALSEKINILRR